MFNARETVDERRLVGDQSMQPSALATYQASRLSGTRLLIEQAIKESWEFKRKVWEIDNDGAGTAKYLIEINGWAFTFIVYSFAVKKEGKTDRIIGSAWDMMAALVEGDMTEEDIEATRVELPKLYEGRATKGTLTWCRSNRSSRLFDYVVASLRSGKQPDITAITKSPYIMRNTGIDGNGTFGTKTFLAYEKDHPLRWSLAAQLMSAYMMRAFSIDLANTLAADTPSSVELEPEVARFLGIGNASGLGLVYYFNNHPKLMSRWLTMIEEEFDRANRLVLDVNGQELTLLERLLERAYKYRDQDVLEYELFPDSKTVSADLKKIIDVLGSEKSAFLSRPSEQRTLETFTATISRLVGPVAFQIYRGLVLEILPVYPEGFLDTLSIDEEYQLVPEMTVSELRRHIEREYDWAFATSDEKESGDIIWYKSRASEEPRRGPASELSNDVVNLALKLPSLLSSLDNDLKRANPTESVARFLATNPQHRAIIARVQGLLEHRYHSFEADMTSERFKPAHIIHFINVMIHGVDKAQDHLGRWVRGILFQGAPLPCEFSNKSAERYWFFPGEPQQ